MRKRPLAAALAVAALAVAVIAVAVIAAAGAPAKAASEATGVEGVWLTGKRKVAVRLYRCDAALCGRIVWLARPRERNGALKRDAANPDAALRDRPWCGVEAITAAKADGDGWRRGRYYNPQDGAVYAVDLAPRQDGGLDVRAYLAVRLLGKSEVWTRYDGDPPPCETDG